VARGGGGDSGMGGEADVATHIRRRGYGDDASGYDDGGEAQEYEDSKKG